MKKQWAILACVMIALVLFTTSCTNGTPKYTKLFNRVEEHRAIFLQPREEALVTLQITDSLGEYDKNRGIIRQEDIITVNQMDFRQEMMVDSLTDKIIGYRIKTLLPRSESGFRNARELVNAFLDRYEPTEDGDRIREATDTIDRMAFPLLPLIDSKTSAKPAGEE
ncbi:hypothetical protein GXP70_08430 [Paenibacillus lycopersici]|uniref:Sporulation protein n=1 Tax=Paenibacillus lycopersici TaxID=2704462 RepID=A0A6C0FYC3_9BACL|nr:hypothetical protein [Paenibacillus lycopersici]QHT59969.1 hypothetical protein GXP70_08430 [Paenibacillus lycopersici]